MERLEGAAPAIRGRAALLDDLGRALEPGGAPTVLVVFRFPGLKESLEGASLESASAWEAKELLRRLAARVAGNVPSAARVYASRRDEFCVLCPAETETSWMRVSAALDEELAAAGIRSCFVVLRLPGEVASADAALRLTDQRLRAQYGTLRPRGSSERI